MNGKVFEVNLDGLVGPTHNYSGLSYGNVASMQNQEGVSNPKEAALQGLEKMKFMSSLGLIQGVLPPHERPHIPTLRALGFQGSEADMLAAAFEKAPSLLFAVSSAAAMWTANAATVSSSFDTLDKSVHFVSANLVSKFHRSIEADFTSAVLKLIFSDPTYFRHHAPLPPCLEFADEGAANHTRFCSTYYSLGVHLFVFGRYAWKADAAGPKIFPARQTFEASTALTRLHRLPEESVIFAQQNPEAIDAGVFHNDVASVGNKNVFLYHERAFTNTEATLHSLKKKLPELISIKIPADSVSLKNAVASYLFNSQLVSIDEQTMVLIAPTECSLIPSVQACLEEILHDNSNPIKKVIHMNLRESMQNGGGPACLRLRVVLSQAELKAAHQGMLLDELLYDKLKAWIIKNYRDRLMPKDLTDPLLLMETREALDELTKILKLGSIYSFQKK
jgi:succinylarginine dihydrolase